MDPADAYFSSLPFSWTDFRVTEEDFLNEEHNFLKIFTISWERGRKFDHMLAFNRWKRYPITPASSAPKPQPQVHSYQPQPHAPRIRPVSLQPFSIRPVSVNYANTQPAMRSISLGVLSLQPACLAVASLLPESFLH